MECWCHFVYFAKWSTTFLGRYTVQISSLIQNFGLPVCYLSYREEPSYVYFCLPSETEAGIFREILQGHIDFESEPWPCISDSAKDLIRNMLNKNPEKRFTAHQVLCEYSYQQMI